MKAFPDGEPHEVPGRIQAEHYDHGPQGESYFDTTPGNAGGVLRKRDVDIAGVHGDTVVGWTVPGEWLAYTIGVPADGEYVVAVRAAHQQGGATFHVGFDDEVVTSGPMTTEPAADYVTYREYVTEPMFLTEGDHTLRLTIDAMTAGDAGNYDWIEVREANAAPSPGE